MDNELKQILKGKTIIVGVGNALRGDDAFGPELVKNLEGVEALVRIDAGSAPENYIGKIIKEDPDTVIIADAAHLDTSPGEYDILRKEEIVKSGFTTHDLSPAMFIEHLEKMTKADIYMLAVQPEKLDFGEEMTDSVKKALNEVTRLIREACNA